jgi:hypothetical protein
MSRRMGLTMPPELASGARLGGKFSGPYNATMAIWKGRPPMYSPDYGDAEPGTLVISAMGGTNIGDSVTVDFEGGNAWGGVTKRTFQIGQGISAELQAGAFQHILCRARAPLPTGMELFFSWTWDPVNKSDLFQYYKYDNAGVMINLPEGIKSIIPESACQLTYQMPQFGTTFVKSVASGEEVTSYWGAFSCNVPNQFIFRLRGI